MEEQSALKCAIDILGQRRAVTDADLAPREEPRLLISTADALYEVLSIYNDRYDVIIDVQKMDICDECLEPKKECVCEEDENFSETCIICGSTDVNEMCSPETVHLYESGPG